MKKALFYWQMVLEGMGGRKERGGGGVLDGCYYDDIDGRSLPTSRRECLFGWLYNYISGKGSGHRGSDKSNGPD